MRTCRINDLRVKTVNVPDDPDEGSAMTTKGRKRGRNIHGRATRKYYDSSSGLNRIHGQIMDEVLCLTDLAIRFYNIKENTNFGQVKLLKVIQSLPGAIGNRIKFEAFSPTGVASVFVAKVTQFLGDRYKRIEISSVKIKYSDSDRKSKSSREELPRNNPQQQTLSDDSLNELAPYISQYALLMHNIFTLRETKEAVHDISSVKVVKAMKRDPPSLRVVEGKKHDAEPKGTTYLVTFEASLRDKKKNVETFETQIFVPTLFPTMTIQFREIQIKHD